MIGLTIPLQGVSEDISKFIKQISVQYRRHATDYKSLEVWQEGSRMPFLGLFGEFPSSLSLSGLDPKTTYDVRVILYDGEGNGNDGDQVPILYSVSTLCLPADTAKKDVKPVNNTINVKINSRRTSENATGECDPSDYNISISGTSERIYLDEDFSGHSGELEYNKLYTVEFRVSDIVEKVDVKTENDPT
ncbi:hypothetical protein B566_EDAN011558, partial [Ephemera danica]